MTPEQKANLLRDQIEKLAMEQVTLLKNIESTALFVQDNGGIGEGGFTLPAEYANAYNALLQVRAVLNGWDITTGVYRQPLNQILPSPR